MAKNIDPYLLIVTMEECGELVQAVLKYIGMEIKNKIENYYQKK